MGMNGKMVLSNIHSLGGTYSNKMIKYMLYSNVQMESD